MGTIDAKCPACNGSGFLARDVFDREQYPSKADDPDAMPCSACDGSGSLADAIEKADRRNGSAYLRLECGPTHYAGCPCHEKAWLDRCEKAEAEIATLTAERDRYRDRVAVVEARSAATPIDVSHADDYDDFIEYVTKYISDVDKGAIVLAEGQTAALGRLMLEAIRESAINSATNFNACARLEAEVRDLAAFRSAVGLWPRIPHATGTYRCVSWTGALCNCGADAANAARAAARKLAGIE